MAGEFDLEKKGRITDEVVIDVNNVHKSFRVYYDKGSMLKERFVNPARSKYENRDILNGISFQIHKGETVALIGNNGCGKSTTLKMLTKILYPNKGSVTVNGKVSSLIELGAGFHPDMSGRENIYINGSILGLKQEQIDERIDEIIRFSELEEYIDNPIRTYSSGMYMRLAFSVAINVDADILLIDEILAVGDQAFQEKCIHKLNELRSAGTTVVLVSHAMGQIKSIADRCIWIDHGKVVEDGDTESVCDHYEQEMEQRRIQRDQVEEQQRLAEHSEQQEEEISVNAAEMKLAKTRDSKEGFWLTCACAVLFVLLFQSVQDIYGIGLVNKDGFFPELTFKMKIAGYAIMTIGRMGVPMVLMCLGYWSLTYDFSDCDKIKKYYLRKFLPILGIWEAWILFYQFFEQIFHGQSFSVVRWLRYGLCLENDSLSYGWLIPYAVVLLFLAPLFGKILHKLSAGTFRFVMIMAWVFLFLFPGMDLYGQANGGETSFHISLNGLCYIFYFCLGYIISLYRISIIKMKKEVIAGVILWLTTLGSQFFFESRDLQYIIYYNFFMVSILALLVFDFSCRCILKPDWLDGLMKRIGKCSVGIFFVHRPVQEILELCLFYRFSGFYLVRMFGLFLLSAIISFAVIHVILVACKK